MRARSCQMPPNPAYARAITCRSEFIRDYRGDASGTIAAEAAYMDLSRL